MGKVGGMMYKGSWAGYWLYQQGGRMAYRSLALEPIESKYIKAEASFEEILT